MNFLGDLFDNPLKVLIVAIVLIVLFGSKKLPGAARSLGQSMRILKREVQGLREDESDPTTTASAPAGPFTQPELTTAPAAPPVDQKQEQIDALQQQIRDLQRAATMDTPQAEPQRTQQPS